LGFEGNMWDS